MRAAGYIRVSTGRMAVEGLSLDAQGLLPPAYAERKGWEYVETFVEEGVSGRSVDRPALTALLGRLSEFDVVIVPKLDRLGRSAKDVLVLYDQFEAQGVAVVSLSPELDTTTSAGRMMRTVLAAAAEFESDMISERVVAVNAGRAAAGKFMGAAPPYGYERVDGALVIGQQAPIVQRIFREYAAGRPQKQIARALNADGVTSPGGKHWRQSRISTIIRNPIYIGRTTYRGQEFDGAHDAIISVDTWESAQALAAAMSTQAARGRGRPVKGSHLFTQGLLRCAHCGYAMAPRTDSGREHYICMGRTDNGPEFCPQSQIPRALLDSASFEYFKAVALDVDVAQRELLTHLAQRRTEAKALLADARRDLEGAEAALVRFDRLLGEGHLEPAEWRELRAPAVEALAAAQSRVRILDARAADLEGDGPAARARDTVLERVAALNRAVAGEVTSPEGLEDVRAQLLRLFERFEVGRTDLPPDAAMPPREAAERAAGLASLHEHHITVGPWVVLDYPRPETIDPLEMDWRPTF